MAFFTGIFFPYLQEEAFNGIQFIRLSWNCFGRLNSEMLGKLNSKVYIHFTVSNLCNLGMLGQSCKLFHGIFQNFSFRIIFIVFFSI